MKERNNNIMFMNNKAELNRYIEKITQLESQLSLKDNIIDNRDNEIQVMLGQLRELHAERKQLISMEGAIHETVKELKDDLKKERKRWQDIVCTRSYCFFRKGYKEHCDKDKGG